jgi:hypothetical protein
MVGRMYSISFEAVTVTVAQDFFELLSTTEKPFKVHALSISQSSDAGDAASEQLIVRIFRVTASPTSGSGGSTATPTPLIPNDAASSVTAEINNTTRLTGGTAVTLHRQCFNVMAGLDIVFTPECRPVVAGATRLVVGLEAAPADSLTMSGTIYIEEIV